MTTTTNKRDFFLFHYSWLDDVKALPSRREQGEMLLTIVEMLTEALDGDIDVARLYGGKSRAVRERMTSTVLLMLSDLVADTDFLQSTVRELIANE